MYVPYAAYALLGLFAVLIAVGVFSAALRAMRVPAWAAFLFVLALLGGSVAPAVWIGSRFSFSVGGWLIPFIFAVCLLLAAGFTREMGEMWLSSFITAAAVFALRYFIPLHSLGLQFLSATLIGLIAGAISYLVGRSRRGAFVSAVFGVTFGALAVFLADLGMERAPVLALGTAGMLDSAVIAALAAVLLAHFLGELGQETAPAKRRAGTPRPANDTEAGEDFGKK
ncbi:MAG: DUF1614 domain-containing protein [Clostridiales bacterium]|jgi:uncharacterized membrane protein|nr:DUF1614 domain-containing protein [Clostridiales bacterium]